MTNWQPRETAPKDSGWVWLRCRTADGAYVVKMGWWTDVGRGLNWYDSNRFRLVPSHWFPAVPNQPPPALDQLEGPTPEQPGTQVTLEDKECAITVSALSDVARIVPVIASHRHAAVEAAVAPLQKKVALWKNMYESEYQETARHRIAILALKEQAADLRAQLAAKDEVLKEALSFVQEVGTEDPDDIEPMARMESLSGRIAASIEYNTGLPKRLNLAQELISSKAQLAALKEEAETKLRKLEGERHEATIQLAATEKERDERTDENIAVLKVLAAKTAEVERLMCEREENYNLTCLVGRLCRALSQRDPGNKLVEKARAYVKGIGKEGSPLRAALATEGTAPAKDTQP